MIPIAPAIDIIPPPHQGTLSECPKSASLVDAMPIPTNITNKHSRPNTSFPNSVIL